jgi:hypothetical protein
MSSTGKMLPNDGKYLPPKNFTAKLHGSPVRLRASVAVQQQKQVASFVAII